MRSRVLTMVLGVCSVLAAVAPAAAAPVTAEPDDERLLELVQRRTFRFFWDLGHPACGLALERATVPDTVTTGGSGFGLMALVVGAGRGWVTPRQALGRLARVVAFLERADRFHGAWPHWLDGRTGRTLPFWIKDDGADLVETAFLVQGLLAARQHFGDDGGAGSALGARITALVRGVEWSWFTRGGQDVLYWHWSPTYGWEMDHPIRGWNEALVVYVLAAGSPTWPIRPAVYHRGWAGGDDMLNGATYLGTELPLGPPYGGPLFFTHYSFLGIDPRGLSDRYADYGAQNLAHVRINRAHCVANPHGHPGYGPGCWGLTASDTPGGYEAHSPTNDRGVIAPTAAVASMPYLPAESMEALRTFLQWQDGRLFGPYGFKDAFQPGTGWVAEDYLAIDQGPVVVMLENHRTSLLWRLVGSCPEVRTGLARLGFIRR